MSVCFEIMFEQGFGVIEMSFVLTTISSVNTVQSIVPVTIFSLLAVFKRGDVHNFFRCLACF